MAHNEDTPPHIVPATDNQAAAPYVPYQDAMYYNANPRQRRSNHQYRDSRDNDLRDDSYRNSRRNSREDNDFPNENLYRRSYKNANGRNRVVEEHTHRRRRYRPSSPNGNGNGVNLDSPLRSDEADVDAANGIQEDHRPSPKDFFGISDMAQVRRGGVGGVGEDEPELDEYGRRTLHAAALANARRGMGMGGPGGEYYSGAEYADARRRGQHDSQRDSQRSSQRERDRSRRRGGDGARGVRTKRDWEREAEEAEQHRPKESYTLMKAAKSALMAGGAEAFRCRQEPGSWSGQKGKRVALAATTGVLIGTLRNGRLLNSGKMPYAEAAMTGFYSIDFLKRVIRHTEFDKNSKNEKRDWREEARGEAPWQVADEEDENEEGEQDGGNEKGGKDGKDGKGQDGKMTAAQMTAVATMTDDPMTVEGGEITGEMTGETTGETTEGMTEGMTGEPIEDPTKGEKTTGETDDPTAAPPTPDRGRMCESTRNLEA
ncbi:uncharacterized protein MYCGRDRAFT_97369 [Zymoseptoria tritici IPO323]|uniref:Uncharacterized protein n=1 Tax=Zymoseptoria tritici (strain CBS 115943 / IPO323) TaxID=336722 RepID=F9XQ04_ZYMTI|nr:uncharacterized protein MYCGRDRAFT_97369 [Zymoseptoria tritici IPO323]EGP82557.1 hypothetical protein MYCGRDRAFT_97369 [Zymoseptoria tritici IPO323]